MVSETGWTTEYLDEKEFPEVLALLEHWESFPPASILLRWQLGYKPPAKRHEVDPLLLASIPGGAGDARKLSQAPMHIRLAVAQLKEERKRGRR